MVETGVPHASSASARSVCSASLHASRRCTRLKNIAERFELSERQRRGKRIARAKLAPQRIVIAHEHAEVARIGARVHADQPPETLPLVRPREADRVDAV